MEWRVDPPPELGDTRKRRKFLLFPKVLPDSYGSKVRIGKWLCVASYTEMFTRTFSSDGAEDVWVEVAWCDE